jgi:hypothetical protein
LPNDPDRRAWSIWQDDKGLIRCSTSATIEKAKEQCEYHATEKRKEAARMWNRVMSGDFEREAREWGLAEGPTASP